MKKKFHVRQTICTVLGILLVISLFGAAMIFPGYYSQLYDKKTLNHVSFTDFNVSTYETSYNSFVEKFHAMARAGYEPGELRAVRTNELEATVNRTNLTQTVNEEFQKLYELKLLTKKIKPKEKRLVQCERYTIYETKGTEGMKGISVWKLVYENSKRKITIFLDEEYHKIYYMDIYYNQPQSVTDISGNESIGYSKVSDYDVPVGSYEKLMYYCWPLLVEYYDINSYNEGSWGSWIEEEGNAAVLEFDEQYQIRFTGTLDTGGNFQRYHIGIPLEKMIQF